MAAAACSQPRSPPGWPVVQSLSMRCAKRRASSPRRSQILSSWATAVDPSTRCSRSGMAVKLSPMSKRKRAPKPTPDESTDDASVKEDMVHVTPDLLSGSPDIFAARKPAGEATETTEIPEASQPPETVAEPIEPEGMAPAEPTEASTTLTPESPPPAFPEPAPGPTAAPPPYSYP